MGAAVDIVGNPVKSTSFNLSMKNEQADAKQDCLARPNSLAQTGTEKYSFSLFN